MKKALFCSILCLLAISCKKNQATSIPEADNQYAFYGSTNTINIKDYDFNYWKVIRAGSGDDGEISGNLFTIASGTNFGGQFYGGAVNALGAFRHSAREVALGGAYLPGIGGGGGLG